MVEFSKKTKREFFHNKTTLSEEATLWLSLITSITVAFAFIFSFVGGWVTERFVKASNFTFFMTLADLEENLPFLWPQLSSRLVLL